MRTDPYFYSSGGQGNELGGFGWHQRWSDRVNQAAVAEHEALRGNVAFVGTKDFCRPKEESPSGPACHWNRNAETCFLIGDEMAEAMLELLSNPTK